MDEPEFEEGELPLLWGSQEWINFDCNGADDKWEWQYPKLFEWHYLFTTYFEVDQGWGPQTETRWVCSEQTWFQGGQLMCTAIPLYNKTSQRRRPAGDIGQ